MATTRKFNPKQRSAARPHSDPGAWTAPTVSPEMVGEQQLSHNWQKGGIDDEYDSDDTTSTSSDERAMNGFVPMGSISKEDTEPPRKYPRTEGDIISGGLVKKPHTSDDVAVKQECHVAKKYVLQEDPGGGFFRCSQTQDKPQPPRLTSLLVGEVLSFLFCKSRNRHQSPCVSAW